MFSSKKGMKMALFGDSNGLLVSLAHNYLDLGWSVIPLQGDANPQKSKSPALLSWAAYQRRQPSKQEISHWFVEEKHSAMAIVLGAVSGVVVLDIDLPERAEEFARSFPQLTETLTIVSGNRKLPHYYFSITPELHVPSRRGGSVELRSNGQYVVAPGVCIKGRTWEITNDVPPRKLTELDLRRILNFLHRPHETCEKGANRRSDVTEAQSSCDPDVGHDFPKLTPARLKRNYRKWADEHGRNNALFDVACYARDHGWTRAQVETVLVTSHVERVTYGGHEKESIVQRKREALRTIASAFSRPARPLRKREDDCKQLPNAVREKLLQLGLDKVARLLDGLMMAGFEVGKEFVAAEAYAAVAEFGIGRNATFATLKTRIPLQTSPNCIAYAAERCAEQTNQCLFGRVAKPGINRGRPATVFIMPSIDALCELLKVENKGGDRLKVDDLQSPAAYRRALHVALIERSPGKYPRLWLSSRLGISKATCRRYERQARIEVMPTFDAWSVHWGNVDSALPDDPVMGQFIEDDRGKRYPPLRTIARMLLGHGRRVVYRSQDANHYSLPSAIAMMSAKKVSQRKIVFEPKRHKMLCAPWAKIAVSRTVVRSGTSLVADSNIPIKPDRQHRETCLPLKLESERKSVIDVEKVDDRRLALCTEKVYQALKNANPQRSLTRMNAEKLVVEYGVSLVERGLKVMGKRRSIRNPAGFLKVWLRSEKAFAGVA
jgi:hypothetical protein